MSWHFPCVVILLAMLSACHPKVDTSSTTALVASVAKVQLTLKAEERKKFDDALLTVAFNDMHDANLLDLAKHAEDIVPDAKAAIHGKTAPEIIAQAAHIRKTRGRPR